MKKRFQLLFFGLTILVSGCATQSWSYLYTQEPSPQQGKELIRIISDHLVHEFGFGVLPERSHGNDLYVREYAVIGQVKISLKEGKYPLVYIQVPSAQEGAAEVQEIFRMIAQSYMAVGLPIHGPAKETWLPPQ